MKTRTGQLNGSMARMLLAVILAAALPVAMVQPALAAAQIDIVGPPGSGAFGTSVTVLPNGNIVVVDPYYDAGAIADVGAVYLYDGATGTQISMLTGSTAGDRVGCIDWSGGSFCASGVMLLSNGNYLVFSSRWDNAASRAAGAADAGAVTWCSGTTGVNGIVSAANSLVGSTAGDGVGDDPWISNVPGLTELSNGNYLVWSPLWDNAASKEAGGAADAGAVTWGSGTSGVSGEVSAANSLVGTTAGDMVGSACDDYGGCSSVIRALGNGSYLVWSPLWDNGGVADAGAVTWGSGTSGVSGEVSAANSLVGSTAGDHVGSWGYWGDVTELSDGNYVLHSPYWDNVDAADAGAVTWGSGTSGVSGEVSAANSLVGTTAGDMVGSACDDYGQCYSMVKALSNGSYLVPSPHWDNAASREAGTAADAGAVTWGNGTTGIAGPVSAANSLVGATAGDRVGYNVTPLANGNYVVTSPYWDSGTVSDAGAITWGNGATGIQGVPSAANSLVGSRAGDRVGCFSDGCGDSMPPLSNGNYVVVSRYWDNGAMVDAGAVTWGSGATGVNGVVSAANSLVGSTTGDQVGCASSSCSYSVTELSSGNYLVFSHFWDNGAATDAGAVTWGDGTTGVKGVLSAANSLVGSRTEDWVGWNGVTKLSNGNYVVSSGYWDNGTATDAGAVTWGSGTAGARGPVSAVNSLVGSRSGDHVGSVTALSNGHYVVSSPSWDNGTLGDVGAITWGNGMAGVTGPVSAANSLVGSTPGDMVGHPGVTALNNGNYVVRSTIWDNAASKEAGAAWDAGAATWGNGMAGVTGPVSAANSLVGSSDGDMVGEWVEVLNNGNYVVHSPSWNNVDANDAGAATWGNGTTGTGGPVSAANSLVGTTAGDHVGAYWNASMSSLVPTLIELSNGNYVVHSPDWDNAVSKEAGAAVNAGAATWCSGTTGVSGPPSCTGPVSAANSLVGSSAEDRIGCLGNDCGGYGGLMGGYEGVIPLSSGRYIVRSPNWDNGGLVDTGAVTWGHRPDGAAGPITADNSVRGLAANQGEWMQWGYDPVHRQLVVGRPGDNIVTLFRLDPTQPVFLPVVLKNAP